MTQSINTALLVDDDPIIRQLLQGYLQNKGVQQIFTAENGSEGRGLLEQHQGELDLIFSDIHMPDTNGIEFLDHLRELKCTVPLVVISSAQSHLLTSAKVLAGAYNLNLLGTLTKPVDFAALNKLLGFDRVEQGGQRAG